HWKSYAFYYKNKVFLYIGSANFTNGGLTQSGEWLIKMTASRVADKVLIQKWENTFFEEWNQAIPIAEFKVGLYKDILIAKGLGSFDGLHPDLKAQLDPLKDQFDKDSEWTQARVILIRGYLFKKTVQEVECFQTEWSRRNW